CPGRQHGLAPTATPLDEAPPMRRVAATGRRYAPVYCPPFANHAVSNWATIGPCLFARIENRCAPRLGTGASKPLELRSPQSVPCDCSWSRIRRHKFLSRGGHG